MTPPDKIVLHENTLQKGHSICELLCIGQICELNSQAIHLVESGRVSVNGQRVTDPATVIDEAYLGVDGTARINLQPENLPGPVEFSQADIGLCPVLKHFHYNHLPEHLQAVSQPFCQLAKIVHDRTPQNDQRDLALQKLLEAKDCAVRAMNE